jgi:hypothetical protein
MSNPSAPLVGIVNIQPEKPEVTGKNVILTIIIVLIIVAFLLLNLTNCSDKLQLNPPPNTDMPNYIV